VVEDHLPVTLVIEDDETEFQHIREILQRLEVLPLAVVPGAK
jgi:hypothetical protein